MVEHHIGVVHFSSADDISSYPTFAADCACLQDDGYIVHDYASGRATLQEQMEGFHAALRDQKLTAIWVYRGGTQTILALDLIDWELVKAFQGPFFGLSDFTHFALKAWQLGKTCFYGRSLRRLSEYCPLPQQREDIRAALSGTPLFPPVSTLQGDMPFDTKTPIIGGHTQISLLMIPDFGIDLRDKYLFVEHHYADNEGWEEMLYWFSAIRRLCRKNPPKGILLGHSLFSENNERVDWQIVNARIVPYLNDLQVYSWNHVQTVVPFIPHL